MTVTAASVKGKIVITISNAGNYRLERKQFDSDDWLVYTASGFAVESEENPAIAITTCDVLDAVNLEIGKLYQYRIVDFDKENPEESDYTTSSLIKCGETTPIGYSFENYHAPEGQWGELVTPDDIRYVNLM